MTNSGRVSRVNLPKAQNVPSFKASPEFLAKTPGVKSADQGADQVRMRISDFERKTRPKCDPSITRWGIIFVIICDMSRKLKSLLRAICPIYITNLYN